ncbi:MAG: hypothetical protein II458_08950 [Oscillospiraceae bacterium]|nr:hypothetical protein [Oscillospiraceae bacterium]
MKHRRILSAILALAMVLILIPCITVPAHASTYGEVVMTGRTGDCTYSVVDITDGSKTRYKLIISGNGKMEDYGYTYIDGFKISTAPWMGYIWLDMIKRVEIQDGVTSIGSCLVCTQPQDGTGAYAFVRSGIERVTIADSVTEIHDNAFYGNTSLGGIIYSGTLEQWEAINIAYNNEPIKNSAVRVYAFRQQPESRAVAVGETATFSVDTNIFAYTYQWQYSDNGTKWNNCTSAGYDTSSFSVTGGAANNGRQYRCVVTNMGDSFVSDTAVLTVSDAKPEITSQPKDANLSLDKTAKFTVKATGRNLTYQWYYKKPGGSWAKSSLTGSKTATLSVSVTSARNGYQYKCLVKDANGVKVYSSPASLTVKTVVTNQPVSQIVTEETTVKFAVKASGVDLVYQWYYKAPGGSWAKTSLTGNKTATLTVKATAVRNGYQYKCLITDANGKKTYSSVATLTVTK